MEARELPRVESVGHRRRVTKEGLDPSLWDGVWCLRRLRI